MANCFGGCSQFDHSFEASVKAHFLPHTPYPPTPSSTPIAELGKIAAKERGEKVGWRVAAPPPSFPAHSQDGHIVSLNKSNGWRCDKAASVAFRFTQSARPSSPHSQVTACGSQQGPPLVFTQLLDGKRAISLLAAKWKNKGTLIPAQLLRLNANLS